MPAPIRQQPAQKAAAQIDTVGTDVDQADEHEQNESEPVRGPIPSHTGVLEQEAPDLIFDPSTVYDRAYGAILGQALGDALGLQVEGNDAYTISDRYPDSLKYPYKGAFKGYQPNDWTDATDFTVLVMRSLSAYFSVKTESPATDFASRINSWLKNGFSDLGDTVGLTPEGVVFRTAAQQGFLHDPIGAATQVRGPKAENGALIRTAPCAFTRAPDQWAQLFCEATHSDDRCLGASQMLVILLNELVRLPDKSPIDPNLAVEPIKAGSALVQDPARRAEFLRRLTKTKRITDLELGDRENRSYVVKTLACAVWAFRQLVVTPPSQRGPEFFRKTVEAVARQGGDTSANCSVVGSVLGAAIGARRLPEDWVEALPHGAWLKKEIAAFLQAAAPTWEI